MSAGQAETLDPSIERERREAFPIGARITLADMDIDPYPIYTELRQKEPVSWAPSLRMWYVTSYEMARSILTDAEQFTVEFEGNITEDILGPMMLSRDGAHHGRFKNPMKPGFTVAAVRKNYEDSIHAVVNHLLDEIAPKGEMEFRADFASRLPILVTLKVFGMPLSLEPELRALFDSFEAALANYGGDPELRAGGKAASVEFHRMIRAAMASGEGRHEHSFLPVLEALIQDQKLTEDEICHNANVIFFGGISTVEALILNMMWAFAQHPDMFDMVKADPATLQSAVEETMRWLSPVQSAHRVAARDLDLGGVRIGKGELISVMLGAANRDPARFTDPDVFKVGRPGGVAHLGFATGPHFCLGLNLARVEVRIAFQTMLARLPGLRVDLDRTEPPRGWEFRQSRRMRLIWTV